MYFVYFLRSLKKNGWIYTGSTNNIERRLKEHMQGLSKYTKSYLPLYLDSYIAVQTDIKARKLEQYFKTGSGIAILKKRILNGEALA